MLMQTRDGYVTGRASAAIREAGLSVTMPRLAVWMILEQAQAPLLVVDVERALLSSGIRVPLSSVYAALKRLSGSDASPRFDTIAKVCKALGASCRADSEGRAHLLPVNTSELL